MSITGPSALPARGACLWVSAAPVPPIAATAAVASPVFSICLRDTSSPTSPARVVIFLPRLRRLELFIRARKLECVVFPSGDFHSGTGRLYIPAHYVEAIADDAHPQAMTRDWHRRHFSPRGACRIVSVGGSESGHHVGILIFAAGDIDASAIHTGSDRAARNRHTRTWATPLIRGWIVFLDHGDVRGHADERRPDPPTDHVNLSVDDANGGMVARSRHRTALAPGIGRGIVFLNRPHRHVRVRRKDGRFL